MKSDASNIHEHIRLEAFLLSEQAGHPTGMDKTFWTQAEAIVHGRAAVVAGAGKAVPKPKAKAASKAKPKTSKKVASKKSLPPAKAEAPTESKAKPAAKRAK